jgi:putative tRNA adenosine deaminase-associated protein
MSEGMDAGAVLRPSFAVRVTRAGDRWECVLLAAGADDELPVLERALGEPEDEGWPGPFVIVVDSRLYFVVLRHGPGGMVRALISDATFQEWLLAAEVVERYGIAVDTTALDEDEEGWPGGDLDVLADAGLPADQLAALLDSDELWADEMVLQIADRLGFADALTAAAGA